MIEIFILYRIDLLPCGQDQVQIERKYGTEREERYVHTKSISDSMRLGNNVLDKGKGRAA